MDPFTLLIGAASVGLTAFGAVESSVGANAYSGQTKSNADAYIGATQSYANTVNPLYAAKSAGDVQIARNEQAISAQQRQFMELSSQRQGLENIRNAQRARATAISSATSQGAGQSSGIGGGLGHLGGQFGTNARYNSNSLEMGRNIFDLNEATSAVRMGQYGIETSINQNQTNFQTASNIYQANQATNTANFQANNQKAAGFSSLGQSLASSLGPLGKIFSGGGNSGGTGLPDLYGPPGGFTGFTG